MTEHPTNPLGSPRRMRTGLAAAALLALGGTVGAVAGHAMRPAIEMAPMQPLAIRALTPGSAIVTIHARVQDVYGNKFVAADPTGRTLVDLGPEGDRTALVAAGQTVTVQGRFDRGVLHASFLVDAGSKVLALGPAGGPPHGPPDRHGPPPAPGSMPPPPAGGPGGPGAVPPPPAVPAPAA